VLRAPEFFILRYLVDYSPKITFPKSISLFSIEIKAFLQVHTRGISIRPVSDRIGNVEFMSWFSYGVNVIIIFVARPADILPDGL
jgi:hypothetical protein